MGQLSRSRESGHWDSTTGRPRLGQHDSVRAGRGGGNLGRIRGALAPKSQEGEFRRYFCISFAAGWGTSARKDRRKNEDLLQGRRNPRTKNRANSGGKRVREIRPVRNEGGGEKTRGKRMPAALPSKTAKKGFVLGKSGRSCKGGEEGGDAWDANARSVSRGKRNSKPKDS